MKSFTSWWNQRKIIGGNKSRNQRSDSLRGEQKRCGRNQERLSETFESQLRDEYERSSKNRINLDISQTKL